MDKDEAHKQEPVRAWFTADDFVEMAERRTKEWAKQADIPDLIAGALGVSRGTAYDLMRDALKEAAPVQEPVAYVVWGENNVPALTFSKPANTYVFDALYNEPRSDSEMVAFARKVEAKLKERNQ